MAPTSQFERVGTIKAETGLLVVGDRAVYDERWIGRAAAQGGWAVDVTCSPGATTKGAKDQGEVSKACYLATAYCSSHPVSELADGTIRITGGASTQMPLSQAQFIGDQITKRAAAEGWNEKTTGAVKVRVHPLNATAEQAADAVRGKGAAEVPRHGLCALEAPAGSTLGVSVARDSEGRVTALLITLD